jgi:hypothetical protein
VAWGKRNGLSILHVLFRFIAGQITAGRNEKESEGAKPTVRQPNYRGASLLVISLVAGSIFCASDPLLAHPEMCSQYCDAFINWGCELVEQHDDHCLFNCPAQGMTCWCSDEIGIVCGDAYPRVSAANHAIGEDASGGMISPGNPVAERVVQGLNQGDRKGSVRERIYLKPEEKDGAFDLGVYHDLIFDFGDQKETKSMRVGPYETPIDFNNAWARQVSPGSENALICDANPPPTGANCASNYFCQCPPCLPGVPQEECEEDCDEHCSYPQNWCVEYDCGSLGNYCLCFWQPEPQPWCPETDPDCGYNELPHEFY